jgi:DNA-binding MarR family transcriptional regulator
MRRFEEEEEGAGSAAGDRDAPPTDTKLALRVHVRLASCRNLLMRESRRSVERWGLTLPQFDALAELGRASRGGFTFGELSSLLLVTSGNLTGIVDRLEAEGLVQREQGKEDRRVVRIVLTRKGKRLVDQITPLHAEDIENALAFMSTEELTALNELLARLRRGLRDRLSASRL